MLLEFPPLKSSEAQPIHMQCYWGLMKEDTTLLSVSTIIYAALYISQAHLHAAASPISQTGI